MPAEVNPTRSESIKLKAKISLAISGHSLLKKKRDGLIMDFFEILEKVKSLRADIVEEYKKSLYSMNMARLMESDLKLKSVALAVSQKPIVEIKTKNIMGVTVPRVEGSFTKKSLVDRGYGVFVLSAIDEAAESYEKVIEKIIFAAEAETSMRKILQEIEKTKRRVNALEYIVIPNLQKSLEFVRLRLEEIERENTFRLKRIKKKQSNKKIKN